MIDKTPYEGEKRFIFTSYSHANKDAVHKILDKMQADGYRIWYDQEILLGEDWADRAADKIEECDCFIGFVSEAYVGSKNATDELQYAYELDKRIILIYLESVKLPGRLRMRLSSNLALMSESYSSEDELLKILYERGGLEDFKGEPVVQKDNTVLEPAPQAVSPASVQNAAAERDAVSEAGRSPLDPRTIVKREGNKIYYADGIVYEGEQKDGKPDGHGTKTFPTGNVFTGYFRSGTCIRGKLTFGNGVGEYIGTVTSPVAIRNGYGKMIYSDGNVYEGEWLNNKRHGQGKMILANGYTYDGEWVNNFPVDPQAKRTISDTRCAVTSVSGNKIKCKDGEYEGEIKNGLPDGKGVKRFTKGHVFTGTFRNGECVEGKLVFKNGSYYVGEFVSGNATRHGWGKMTYTSGDVYEGEWRDGKMNGRGTMTYADGSSVKGVWKDNKRIQ